MSSTIDLDTPPPNHTYSVSVQPEETAGERRVRLFKDLALFVVAVGFAVVIAWLRVSALSSNAASAQKKKWAMSVPSAATGGIIGYLVRK